jgi:hypothetical protein
LFETFSKVQNFRKVKSKNRIKYKFIYPKPSLSCPRVLNKVPAVEEPNFSINNKKFAGAALQKICKI